MCTIRETDDEEASNKFNDILAKGGIFPSHLLCQMVNPVLTPFISTTYGNKDLKSFRMRTYRKDGRGVGLRSPCG